MSSRFVILNKVDFVPLCDQLLMSRDFLDCHTLGMGRVAGHAKGV